MHKLVKEIELAIHPDIMVHSHCPTPPPRAIQIPIKCAQNSTEICIGLRLWAIWIPPHNSTQAIFIGLCICLGLCQCKNTIIQLRFYFHPLQKGFCLSNTRIMKKIDRLLQFRSLYKISIVFAHLGTVLKRDTSMNTCFVLFQYFVHKTSYIDMSTTQYECEITHQNQSNESSSEW